MMLVKVRHASRHVWYEYTWRFDAVRRLKTNQYGAPTRMREEHLQEWLAEAQKEEAAAAKEKEKTAEGAAVDISGNRSTRGGGDGGEEGRQIPRRWRTGRRLWPW